MDPTAVNPSDGNQTELALKLAELLKRLAVERPRQARVAEMRLFGGRSDEETAAAMGVAVRTVWRDWAMARAWLHQQLTTPGIDQRTHGPQG